jgi:hypothetical protein
MQTLPTRQAHKYYSNENFQQVSEIHWNTIRKHLVVICSSPRIALYFKTPGVTSVPVEKKWLLNLARGFLNRTKMTVFDNVHRVCEIHQESQRRSSFIFEIFYPEVSLFL